MVITCPNHKGLKSISLYETIISCNSKHLIDEHTLSHFFSGFYLRSNFKKVNFKIMLFLGIFWEIFERTHYAKQIFNFLGVIAGVSEDSYTGDSLINSISDVMIYVYGWKLAGKYDKINDNGTQKCTTIIMILTLIWASSFSYLKTQYLYK